jgi:hypothetical protein
MNLIDLFDLLTIPEQSTETHKVLSATPLPDYPNFRIAVNSEGNPVLLFSPVKAESNIKINNVRLKYLALNQNIECKVIENKASRIQSFTLITFTSPDRHLQEYFLHISETLVKSLGIKSTEKQIADTLLKFVEIFRALSDTPTNTVQGLWSELFLISISHQPNILIDYWHSVPEEKYDFNANEERIEVKSSSSMERIHFFSSEQLNPPAGVQVLVASILLKQTSVGVDIQNLIDLISSRIQDNLELIDKLYSIVFKTLGSSLEFSISYKYDPKIAKESLCFYRHQDIIKIELENIPAEVSEVRYRTDLSKVDSVNIGDFGRTTGLFKSF